MTQIMPAAPAPVAVSKPASAATGSSTDTSVDGPVDGVTIDDFMAVLAEALDAFVEGDDAESPDDEESATDAIPLDLLATTSVGADLVVPDPLAVAPIAVSPSGEGPTELEGADSLATTPVEVAVEVDGVESVAVPASPEATAEGTEGGAPQASTTVGGESWTAVDEPVEGSQTTSGAASAATSEAPSGTSEAPSGTSEAPSGTREPESVGSNRPTTPAPIESVAGETVSGAAAEEARTSTLATAGVTPAPTDAPTVSAAEMNSAAPAAQPVAAAPAAPASVEVPGTADPALIDDDPWQQLATVIRPLRQMADGSHRLSLQLRPAELGTVHLEVAVEDGQLSVRAVAENIVTRDVLASAMNDLREELVRSGIDVGSLDVGEQTSDGGGSGLADSNSDVPRTILQPGIAPVGSTVTPATGESPSPVAVAGRLDLSL